MIVKADDFLMHYGIPRRSGRYPWGSGKDPYQRTGGFIDKVKSLKKSGMSEKDIADGFGLSVKDLRQKITVERNEAELAMLYKVKGLADKQYTATQIAKMIGKNESTVREWLDPVRQEKAKILTATSDMLKEQLKSKPYLDIGAGVELDVGVKRTMLDAAIYKLEQEGYKKHLVAVEQLGTGKKTYTNVLTKDDVSTKEVYDNRGKIRTVSDWSDDGGETYLTNKPVKSIDSKRVLVKFAEDGGTDKDGMIELRRGVDDLSLGNKKYAQVRVAVDDTHYMKGMAVYGDPKDFPPGVDVIYNVSKSKKGGKQAAFKENAEDDPTNPFGTTIRQQTYIDKNGNEQISPLNRVGYSSKHPAGEEGYWDTWHSGKALPSQFLAKQNIDVAKEQLKLSLDIQKDKFNAIKEVTNPAVKQRLLDSFADDSDAKAVHLEGAALPRQSTKVLLSVPSLKENEAYSPSHKDGEKLMLIRFPHAGTFEIPVVTVNNKNKEGRRMLGNDAIDAIAIHPKASAKLSGADNDGDSVIAIPATKKLVSSESLKGLKDFDPKKYKLPDDITKSDSFKDPKSPQHKMTDREKGLEMGGISNLITDMTVKRAAPDELARAVRHSMVVIDAQKHDLDYKASANDNRISELKEKYQGRANAGASTILSRATAETRPLATRPLRKGDPGYEDTVRRNEYSIDKETGRKVFAVADPKQPYVNKNGELVTPKPVKKISTRMYDTEDARTLLSDPKKPAPMELVYADYANGMKELGNQARKESAKIKPTKYSPSAKATYAEEVKSLDAKLANADRNAPKERQAMYLGNEIVKMKVEANPNLTASQLKKIKGQALETARNRVGAGKERIQITEKEWEAIQAGAITHNKLTKILNNTKIEDVQKLATPRTKQGIPASKVNRAKAMLNRGYTLEQIADALGISASSVAALK